MPSLAPRINLLVLKLPDIDRAANFYRLLDVSFERHQHGSWPWHYASELDGLVFEIYPGQPEGTLPAGMRLGFQVSDLDATLGDLRRHGVKVIQEKARANGACAPLSKTTEAIGLN